MKGHSEFPKAPALLEPHHQIYCHIQDTRWGSRTPLQRCSRFILQPQATGQNICWVFLDINYIIALYVSFSLHFYILRAMHLAHSWNIFKHIFYTWIILCTLILDLISINGIWWKYVKSWINRTLKTGLEVRYFVLLFIDLSTFHIFPSYCQIHHNLSFQHEWYIYIYIYIYKEDLALDNP